MDISTLLNLINYIFVLIFGIIVSFYFADIRLEDNHKLFIYTTLTFALFQAVCYLLLGHVAGTCQLTVSITALNH